MRLFYRSFYSFMALIVFQALLTGLLVTSITERNNNEDAREELGQKADLSYQAINGWVRSLWQEMMTIQNEGVSGVTDAPFSAEGLLRIEDHFANRLFAAGFDYFMISQSPRAWSRTVVNPRHHFVTLSPTTLLRPESHPNVRYYREGGAAAMVGGLYLHADDGRSLVLFIVKRLDDAFCRSIASRSGSEIFLSTVDEIIGGSVPISDITASLSLGEMEVSYGEHEQVLVGEQRYRAAVRRVGRIAPGQANFYLSTLVSDSRYAARIRLIARTATMVSAFAAILSLLISVFLSRYLSRPAQLLLSGMRNVKQGLFETQLDSPSKDEFGVLFRGFNSMVVELQEDRKRMDRYIAEITQLKEYNEAIIHSIGAGIAIIGKDLRVKKSNSTFDFFAEESGESAGTEGRAIGELSLRFVDDAISNRINEVVHGERRSYVKRSRSAEDRVYDVKLYPLSQELGNVSTEGCVLLVEDVTARDALESKMYQAEKIASISLLSAGVAHEINNPLDSITTNVQNLISEIDDEEQTIALELIEEETRRIARIVRGLLDFATSTREPQSFCDLAQVVRDTSNLVHTFLRQDNDAHIRISEIGELPPVAMGKDALRQIVMNLLLNATQAVEGGGIVTVKSEARDGFVVLTISDNGCGIPEEYRSRIFDPFFTTKPNGRGTGLGLSVVYGIVTEYGGAVHVESKEGEGTSVELLLPRKRQESLQYA
jgi:signal transduction histidine kinase/HAMP domain-containing protein